MAGGGRVRADAGEDGEIPDTSHPEGWLHEQEVSRIRPPPSDSSPPARTHFPGLGRQSLASGRPGATHSPIKWPHGADAKEADEDVKIINREHSPGWHSKKVIPLEVQMPRLKRYSQQPPCHQHKHLEKPQGPLVSNHQMLSEVSRLGEVNKGLPKKKADKLELN